MKIVPLIEELKQNRMIEDGSNFQKFKRFIEGKVIKINTKKPIPFFSDYKMITELIFVVKEVKQYGDVNLDYWIEFKLDNSEIKILVIDTYNKKLKPLSLNDFYRLFGENYTFIDNLIYNKIRSIGIYFNLDNIPFVIEGLKQK